VNPFDPIPLLETLHRHGVAFVLIGGVAGIALGSSLATFDLDICYERSEPNLERLAAALQELHATLRGAPPDLPFRPDARTPGRSPTRTASRSPPTPATWIV
jgi:hypothetical protein